MDKFLKRVTESATAGLLEMTLMEIIKDEMDTPRTKEAITTIAREIREVVESGREPTHAEKNKLIAASIIDIFNRCSRIVESTMDEENG